MTNVYVLWIMYALLTSLDPRTEPFAYDGQLVEDPGEALLGHRTPLLGPNWGPGSSFFVDKWDENVLEFGFFLTKNRLKNAYSKDIVCFVCVVSD